MRLYCRPARHTGSVGQKPSKQPTVFFLTQTLAYKLQASFYATQHQILFFGEMQLIELPWQWREACSIGNGSTENMMNIARLQGNSRKRVGLTHSVVTAVQVQLE
jgi:hypothetical protein